MPSQPDKLLLMQDKVMSGDPLVLHYASGLDRYMAKSAAEEVRFFLWFRGIIAEVQVHDCDCQQDSWEAQQHPEAVHGTVSVTALTTTEAT